MPELPEVETIRRDLSRRLTGTTIRRVDVRLPKMVAPKTFAIDLAGARVVAVRRRAKLLAIDVRRKKGIDDSVLVHLKMTGQLVLRHRQELIFGGHPIVGAKELPNQYSHVIFHLAHGDALYFNDLRQFGYLKLVSRTEANEIFSAYGPEPLSSAFSLTFFEKLLSSHPSLRLKALLLNQTYIAGLGNIYVDEACFRARVRPARKIKSLSAPERRALWRVIRSVIALAVKHRGTSFNTYVDSDGRAGKFWKYVKVYGRKKEACKICATPIVRTVVAGRGTHFCPQCQK